MSNPVKQALLNRELTLGGWVQIGHPAVAEIYGREGFNWVCLDCEHGDTDGAMASVFRAVSKYPSIPFARVEENNVLKIRRALDLGAQGIIVPLVNTAEEAKQAVSAAKYPPEGIRGFAFCRANEWGIDFDEKVVEANEEIAVVAMIESRNAVENIEEILAVKGIDGVFIGPYDMSGSYGITGQTGHPVILEASRKVSEACKKYGKAAGMHIVKPTEENIENARQNGFTFLALGMDTVFLAEGTRKAIALLR